MGSGTSTFRDADHALYMARTPSAHSAGASGPTSSGTHSVTSIGVRTTGTSGASPVWKRPLPRTPSPGADAGYSTPRADAGSAVDDADATRVGSCVEMYSNVFKCI